MDGGYGGGVEARHGVGLIIGRRRAEQFSEAAEVARGCGAFDAEQLLEARGVLGVSGIGVQCGDQILGFDKPFAKQARGKGKCRPLILARWSGNQPQRSPSRASGGGGQACTCQS